MNSAQLVSGTLLALNLVNLASKTQAAEFPWPAAFLSSVPKLEVLPPGSVESPNKELAAVPRHGGIVLFYHIPSSLVPNSSTNALIWAADPFSETAAAIDRPSSSSNVDFKIYAFSDSGVALVDVSEKDRNENVSHKWRISGSESFSSLDSYFKAHVTEAFEPSREAKIEIIENQGERTLVETTFNGEGEEVKTAHPFGQVAGSVLISKSANNTISASWYGGDQYSLNQSRSISNPNWTKVSTTPTKQGGVSTVSLSATEDQQFLTLRFDFTKIFGPDGVNDTFDKVNEALGP